MTTPDTDINSLLDQLREQWLEVVRERDELRAGCDQLRKVAHAAIHTVRSYQYSNSSPDLADEFVAFAAKTLNDTMPSNHKGPSE